MKVICEKTDFYIEGQSAVAIGKFDGIHRGHQELLSHILQQKKQGRKAVVFTFFPSATAFFGKRNEKELTTREEKRQLFEELGIDVLVEFPLNQQTAATSPEDFVTEILLKQMNMVFLAAGEDVSFGKGGKGNRELLSRMAKEQGFQLEIIKKVFEKEREISSTYVREEVESGNMEQAAKLLGRYYSFGGVVENGNHLGRTMGTPTVNIYPPEEKLLPPRGVYVSKILLAGKIYYGITNIGKKPTVQQKETISVETYLYDFAEDVYGQEILVELLTFQRPEKKFDSITELHAQIEKDVQKGREYIQKIPAIGDLT